MTQENEAKVKKKKTKKVKSQKYDAEAGVNDKKRLKGIASFSLIIALFDRLWEIICNALVNGFWGNVCSSYTKLQNSYENGFIREFIFRDRRIKRLFRKFRKFLSSQIENCFLVTYGRKTLGFFTSIPLSYYGNFTLFFGIYTIVVFFVKQIIPDIESAGIDYLIFGGSMIVISLPLLFTKLSVASAVMRSTIAKSIIQGCFGVSDEVLARKSSARKGRGNIMLFFGLVAGTLSFFVHPLVIVLFLLVVAILSFVAVTPEIGVLITAFIIPFCSFVDNPTITLSCCVLVTAFFYVIKLIRGKRIFKLELVDGTVLLFGIVIYFASVFSAGGEASRNAALISCVLMLGYFLLVNLMRTEKWIKRCVAALVSSASIVAVIGIFEYFFGAKSDKWLDTRLFAGIRTRVVSLFENPNVLATYLVLLLPFALVYLILSKTKSEKMIASAVCICFVVATVLTWSRSAWIAMIACAIIFFTIYSRKTMRLFGALLLAIPIFPMLLPNNIINRFMSILNFSDSSISYRIYTWIGSSRAIKDYFWGGIGYGPEAFQRIYPYYAYSGIEAAEHSHSLFLQILLAIGIGGLLAFAVFVFLYFQNCSEYLKKPKNKASKFYVAAALVSIIGALIMGVFDYIWFNYRVFYVFWLVVAIGCAFVRVGRDEIERETETYDSNIEPNNND